jgi:hypothetical protein
VQLQQELAGSVRIASHDHGDVAPTPFRALLELLHADSWRGAEGQEG